MIFLEWLDTVGWTNRHALRIAVALITGVGVDGINSLDLQDRAAWASRFAIAAYGAGIGIDRHGHDGFFLLSGWETGEA